METRGSGGYAEAKPAAAGVVDRGTLDGDGIGTLNGDGIGTLDGDGIGTLDGMPLYWGSRTWW